MLYDDVKLKELVASYKKVPKLKPLKRKIEAADSIGGTKFEDVFTYFMYNSLDADNQMDGAVILNVKPEWLMNNIKGNQYGRHSETGQDIHSE